MPQTTLQHYHSVWDHFLSFRYTCSFARLHNIPLNGRSILMYPGRCYEVLDFSPIFLLSQAVFQPFTILLCIFILMLCAYIWNITESRYNCRFGVCFFLKYQKLIFFLLTGEPSRAYGSRASGVSLLVQPAHRGPVIAPGFTKYVLNKQMKAAMFWILTHNLNTILIYQISSHFHKPIHHYPHFINQESLKDEQQQHRLCTRIQICTFPLGLTQRLPHFTSHLYRINANLQGNMLTSTIDKKWNAA